jgi:predicted GIY-YIG superfamily endonuclease
MIGIYKITSPTGKIYIGESSNIEKRIHTYKGKIITFLFGGFKNYSYICILNFIL